MALGLVNLNIEYYPDPTQGRPVFNGSIYVGVANLDPFIEANRVTVYIRQEGAADVPILPAAQPLTTGGGGVILYNGSPAQILVDGNYSLKVLNSAGVQVYYISNAFSEATASTAAIVVSSKAIANSLTVVDGRKVFITSADGGSFTMRTGAAVGTYNDNAGAFTGTQFTNGNGSSGLERDYSGEVNVRWFGAKGDGITDDTSAIQFCVDFCFPLRRIVYFPNGTYLVLTTLTISEGTQIKGETNFQYNAGFGVPVNATTIDFKPVTPLNLFAYAATPVHGNFRFHTSIQGLHIKGTSVSGGDSNSLTALDLNGIIYGRFSDISIQGFMTPVICSSTINNEFTNIYLSGVTQCALYRGTATSDVWKQCSFWGSPVGLTITESTIGVRFIACLMEQIDDFGFDISRDSENIMVTDLYAEDVPYQPNASTAAVFRVGTLGAGSAKITNHLIVNGGHITGRNAGSFGSVFDVDYCEGIQAANFYAANYVDVIKTTANTRNNSITLGGYTGISWNSNIDDLSKITGIYPNGVINSGTYQQSMQVFRTDIQQGSAFTLDITLLKVGGSSVTFGPVDSGGAGSRALIVPN